MLINIEFPTCPDCGDDLQAVAHSELEMCLDGGITVTQVGICDSCGNRFEWKEHYAYKGYSNVEKAK